MGWFFHAESFLSQSRLGLKFLIIWNALVVFIHYLWVIPSLQNKLEMSFWCAGGMYGAVSIVHTVCFALFWLLVHGLGRFRLLITLWHGVTHISIFLLSFPVAGYMIMFIFGGQGCYNMLSPMIPLSKIFVDSSYEIDCNIKKSPIWHNNSSALKNISFFSLKHWLPNTTLPWERAQHLFHALNHFDQSASVVVTPESFFPFPLNYYPEMITFIAHGLKRCQMLFLASQYVQDDNKIFQAVYVITNKGIEHLYLKQHAVPFFEQMPWYLKKYKKISNIFDADQQFSYVPKNIDFCGILHDGVRIVPRLCSDFFLVTSVIDLAKLRHRYGDRFLVVLQVNDTWFIGYMRRLLRQAACMRAWVASVNLVYVGYRDR